METTSEFAKYPSLQDRVVLITGGASGIGEVLVEETLLQRARPAGVVDHDVQPAERLDGDADEVADLSLIGHVDVPEERL